MFVNRKAEMARLKHALKSDRACLVVIYGRRRCGKSALLRRIMNKDAVYFSADTHGKTGHPSLGHTGISY